MKLPNLKELYPGYKYYLEEPSHSWSDEWSICMICKYGHLCLFNATTLMFCGGQNRKVYKQLLKLPYTILYQDADDGKTILFPLNKFKEVRPIIKPKRKKQLSKEHIEKLKMGLKKWRQDNGN